MTIMKLVLKSFLLNVLQWEAQFLPNVKCELALVALKAFSNVFFLWQLLRETAWDALLCGYNRNTDLG